MLKTIGIRELKAHLSRVLRDVAAGDVYLVTDRHTVVAELRTPGGEARKLTRVERGLAALAGEGHLRVAESAPRSYLASTIRVPDGTAQWLIDQERGE